MEAERLVKRCLWSTEASIAFLALAMISLLFSCLMLGTWPREALGVGLLACWLAFNILHKAFSVRARKAMGSPVVLGLAAKVDAKGGRPGKKPLREVFERYDASLPAGDVAGGMTAVGRESRLTEGLFEPAAVRDLAVASGYGAAVTLSRLLAALLIAAWVVVNLYLGGMLWVGF